LIIEGRITNLLNQPCRAEPRLNILFTDDGPPRQGYSTNVYGAAGQDMAGRLKEGDLIRVDGTISEIDEEFNEQAQRRYVEAVQVTRLAHAVIPWVDVARRIGTQHRT
jgi:hypothetical protein